MNKKGRSARIRERLDLRLPVRVHCRETPDFAWSEVTRLIDVTPFGAGFTVKRPTERGRLVHMTIPMPRQLRVFDFAEDQYKNWAVVRYVRPLAPGEDKKPRFEVGVAFIGKRAPASYDEDPTRRYEVSSEVSKGGMLAIKEPTEEYSQVATVNERDTRHNMPVSLLLETFTETGEVAD